MEEENVSNIIDYSLDEIVNTYALVVNNVVVNTISASQEFINEHWSHVEGTWIKTSLNALGGIHYDKFTGEVSDQQFKASRKNYGSVGMLYDPEADAFYSKPPYSNWVLNRETFLWEPPIPEPECVEPEFAAWSESEAKWKIYNKDEIVEFTEEHLGPTIPKYIIPNLPEPKK